MYMYEYTIACAVGAGGTRVRYRAGAYNEHRKRRGLHVRVAYHASFRQTCTLLATPRAVLARCSDASGLQLVLTRPWGAATP